MASSSTELELLVQECNGDVGIVFLRNEDNQQKIADGIKTICQQTDKAKVANFIVDKLIPAVIAMENTPIRSALITLSYELTEMFPIQLLSAAQIRNLKLQIRKSYVQNIELMRKSHDDSWSKIWILLIRYLQQYLHNEVELANALFRIAETGFKDRNDRINSFDCWLELIKNYQLNPNFIESPRHIKLLSTPLLVKFISITETVKVKRFEVWVYFLKVLKEKAIETLDSFLQYCFIACDKQALGGAEFFKQRSPVWKEATEVLLEVLGHKKRCKSPNCWKYTKHTFDVDVITPTNYHTCYEVIINAVVRSCVLSKYWADHNTEIQVATCLWNTVAALNANLTEEAATNVKNKLCNHLENAILSIAKENKPLNDGIVCILENDTTTAFVVFKNILTNKPDGYSDAITTMLKSSSITMEKSKFFHLITRIFTENLACEPCLMSTIWRISYRSFANADPSQIPPIEAATFLISYFLKCTLTSQHEDLWCELLEKLHTTKLDFLDTFVMELQKRFDSNGNNDRLMKSITKMMVLMLRTCGENVERWEVDVLKFVWDSMHGALNSAAKSINDLTDITTSVRVLLRMNVKRFAEQEQVQVVEKASNCVRDLLCNFKVYTILDELEMFIKSLTAPLKIIVSHILKTKISTLTNVANPEVTQKATTTLQALISKRPYHNHTLDLSRGAKLTSMVRNSLENASNNRKTNPLNKSLPDRVSNNEKTDCINKRNSFNDFGREFPKIFGKIDDEGAANFVKIDSAVKFDRTKLSANQRERLKRKRDDIPSLYADLSQSTQSQSLSEDNSSSSNVVVYQQKINADRAIETETKPDENRPIKSNEKCVVSPSKGDSLKKLLAKYSPMVVLESKMPTQKIASDNEGVSLEKSADGGGDEVAANLQMETIGEKMDAVSKVGCDGAVENDDVEGQRGGVVKEDAQVKPKKRGRASLATASPKNERKVRKRRRGRRPTSLSSPKHPREVDKALKTAEKPPAPANTNNNLAMMRELARLKINARIDKLMPGIEAINANHTRVTRRLVKMDEEKSPSSSAKNPVMKPMENNNTEVVESSQDVIVQIKPLGEEKMQDSGVAIESNRFELARKDTESCDPYERLSVEETIDLNRPVVPIMTPSREILMEKETDSLDLENNLPGSPVTLETSTRTTELLLNTSDISPIRTAKTITETPVLIQKTLEDFMQQQNGNGHKVVSCGNRSKKMMETLVNSNNSSNSKVIVETVVSTAVPNQSETEDYLTFKRELPSSSALPASGSILKRKKPDYPDENSPSVKRKRVNFPDPPTTSEKLIPTERLYDKKCKKQLNMDQTADGAVIVTEKIENETELQLKAIIGSSSSSSETVNGCCAEEINQRLKQLTDMVIETINKMDVDVEESINCLLETFERIENAMPPVVFNHFLQKIVENRR